MWEAKYYFTKKRSYKEAREIDQLMETLYQKWFIEIMKDCIQPTRKALKIYKRRDIHASELNEMKDKIQEAYETSLELLAAAQGVTQVDIEGNSALKWAHAMYEEMLAGADEWIEKGEDGIEYGYFTKT